MTAKCWRHINTKDIIPSLATSLVSKFLVEFFSTTSISMKNLSSFCLVFFALFTILNPISALKSCEFPAVFNFGDSNSDTGGLVAAFPPLINSPYGETYFHMPAGRFSDGRLIIDFIAKSFNLSFLSAYLDSLGTNFSVGANFATASSTITLPTTVKPANNGFSPFYLRVQYNQFEQLKARSQLIRKQGGVFAQLMPMEEYFQKALYTFDIGQNDLGAGFFGNKSIEEVNASVPNIVNTFLTDVKSIYNLGARSFWIHNTGPIGCLGYILDNFPSAEKNSVGCAKSYNEVAQYFNHELKEIVLQLRKDFPSAAFTYVDVYSVKYSLFSEPQKQVRVVWDGVHYTEAANKFVFERISTGAFSDPPVPLKLACHST